MSNIVKKKLLFEEHVCPWWLAYSFDHRLRRMFQNPEKILKPYVRRGMTVVDIGCGMGFFSIAMAKLVGENGTVIAADLQQKMLDVLSKRTENANVPDNMIKHKCEQNNIGITQNADFVLTFWMVHEVPDKKALLKQIYSTLNPAGQYLLVEPKIHTKKEQFDEIVTMCKQLGFLPRTCPRIFMSRSMLFIK